MTARAERSFERASRGVVWVVLAAAVVLAAGLALSIGASTVAPLQWFARETVAAELVWVWRAPRVAAAFLSARAFPLQD